MGVQIAHGGRGVVSSGHQLATDAAISVMKRGGNAVDAAICGALVLTVTCPYACSLAGDMYMLVFEPGDASRPGAVSGLNATGRAPSGATIEQFPDGMPRSGIRSATVPGLLAGLADALERFGSLALADLLEPAIALAEGGFAVHPYFAKNIQDREALLRQDAVASGLFLPGGEPLKAGAWFRQRVLAQILRRIARDGIETFYRGTVAKQIVAASDALGGLLTEADFAVHRSTWQLPISGPFLGHTVWTMPPNSYGLTLLLQLIELERTGIGGTDPASLDFLRRGFAARRESYAAAAKFIGDPELAGEQAARILETAIAGRDETRLAGAPPREAAGSSTTNVVVVDEKGLAVSLIQSISTPFGAGVVLDGTGIVLNNRIGGFTTDPGSLNRVAPGRRPAHTLAPCIVTRDGELAMSVGTPGTVGQTCTLAQFLARVLARGESPAAAIEAARWSADFQGRLIVEDSMPEPLKSAALAEGALSMPTGWISFGSIKLAMKVAGGLAAYADDRRSAYAAGF